MAAVLKLLLCQTAIEEDILLVVLIAIDRLLVGDHCQAENEKHQCAVRITDGSLTVMGRSSLLSSSHPKPKEPPFHYPHFVLSHVHTFINTHFLSPAIAVHHGGRCRWSLVLFKGRG